MKLIRFKTFLLESNEELIQHLKDIGLQIKSSTRNSITVLTDENRSEIQRLIAKTFSGKITPPSSKSSLGTVLIDGVDVIVKSLSKQGRSSAGLDNEDILVEKINSLNPDIVIFQDNHGKQVVYKQVSKCEATGLDTSGNKKADIVLKSGNTSVAISIKKDNAEYWESADKRFGPIVKAIIDKHVKKGDIVLDKQEAGHYKIKPEIKIALTPEEIDYVVFGTDIKKTNGCIIKRTFRDEDFQLKNNTLIVKVTTLIQDENDIEESEYPWILVRNDMTRNKSGKNIYPGLRILVAYANRVKKVMEVSR